MPWMRVGDDAATFPPLMGVMGLPDADARTINEVAGFLFRLASLSGAHLTDYVVNIGTCWMVGGARTQELIAFCVRAGLMVPTKDGEIQAVRIVDNPDFIHLKLKEEVEWERQRVKDNRDPALTVHVRRRDGDQCRYCGVVVQWRGRASNRKGTYDHVHPGQAASVETLVVACARCNESRQDDPQWIDDHPLLPVPTHPLYSTWTADFLTKNGYATTANLGGTARRSGASEGITEEVDPGTPDQGASAGPSAAGPGTVEPTQVGEMRTEVEGDLLQRPIKTTSVGSGRDGSDRVGKGQDGQGRVGSGRQSGGGSGRRRRRKR